MKISTLVLSIGILLHSSIAFANIINVPADQFTIQMGILFAGDGDTILVHPGTHPGNVNFNGKNITVASLFLTTNDTSYISSTIINGSGSSSVVTFENEEDSSAVLCGFTITNGGGFAGGGIYCNISNPSLHNLTISGNSASVGGGGIYCNESSPDIKNVTISGNTADHYGGGIECVNNSNLSIENASIIGNHAFERGGGIHFSNSNPTLENVTITDNTSSQYGGGIYSYYSNFNMLNVSITSNSANNDGGGIFLIGSFPVLKYILIAENIANRGAGIYLSSSSPNMQNITITANTASQNGGGICSTLGSYPILINSILWNNSPQEIIGGSPTVTYTDIQGGWTGTGNIDSDPLFVNSNYGSDYKDYHLLSNSSCIDAGDPTSPLDPDGTIVEMGAYYFNHQYDGRIWHISKTGSDQTGSGSEQFPFATIQRGINASSHTDTVLVQPGTYVENINHNGKFITVASLFLTTQDTTYISTTIIDGNSDGSVVTFENGEDITTLLTGFTITNGSATYSGGIYCTSSGPSIKNVIITGNFAILSGGGIFCNNNANPSLVNVTISGNSAEYGGGVYCAIANLSLENVIITGNTASNGGGIYCNESSLGLENVVIINNSATYDGGGIDCRVSSNLSLDNVRIIGNSSANGGGIYCVFSNPNLNNVTIIDNFVSSDGGGIYWYDSSPSLENITMTGNTASNGGGIYCTFWSNLNFVNSIMWNNSPQEIHIQSGTVTATYSNIQGGWAGTGNIDSDPLFVDADNGDYHLSWDNFPIQDATMSPCIDAGDPASQLDPDSTIADIGAYYFYQYLSADFTANIINGEVPLTVNFTDQSAQGAGAIDEWFWDFGDGNTSILQNPSNDYLLPGIYTVSLTVTDVNDSTDTETKVDYITVDLPAYTGPVWHISTMGSDIFGNGSEQYPYASIQHGINSSSNTDTVLVQPGTYMENINFSGKLITVTSLLLTTQDSTYISSTIINGNNSNTVVIFENSEDSTAILYGFTITNGYATNGGGVRCSDSSGPNLQYLIIKGNSTPYNGGGVCCLDGSSPRLKDVIISGNTASTTAYGGGICCLSYSSPYMENVTIIGNSALGSWGSGGGVFCYFESNPIFNNVTISNNVATLYGGGIYCMENSHPVIKNSILWGDTPQEIYISSGSVTATYSDIQGGWPGTGNIDSDPFFVNPDYGSDFADYHLLSNSPCIDAGDPASPLDSDGTIVEMGAHSFNHQYGGQIWYVSTAGSDITGNGSEQFPFESIQRGINASSNSDTVLALPGTYIGNLNYIGKSITIASLFLTLQDTAYIAATIIDGNEIGSSISFDNGEDSTSILTGFVITNGDALYGGGIYFDSSSPTLEHLWITGNTAEFGGGMHMINSSPVLKDVTISGNSATGTYGYGGGINCESSSPSFENVTIAGNSAYYGGGIACIDFNTSLEKVTIIGNTASEVGGGIFLHDSSPYLDRVTIADNTAGNEGGGIYCNWHSNPSLLNSILWNDTPQEIYVQSGSVNATYSDIQGQWIGLGNIDSDPLFENPINVDYHLQAGSPCIDTGDPASSLDPDGSIADMGAYYFASRLNLKVFLQGPFNGTEMNNDLHTTGLIPINQPYDISPWNYTGAESVPSIPENIVDWVLVELRDATNANTATPATTIDQQVAFLRNDGTVVGLDGISDIHINGIIYQNLFVVVRHRNHNDIMSISPVQKVLGIYTYDFTLNGQAIGFGATAHLGSGIYGMYSGDANADGHIDGFDKLLILDTEAGRFDYLSSDLNLDGQSDNMDKNDYWWLNRGIDCQVPE